MVVNPSATQLGGVVDKIGTAGVGSIKRLVNGAEAAEVQGPLVAVTV